MPAKRSRLGWGFTMKPVAFFAHALVAVAALTACNQSPTAPSSRTELATAPLPPPLSIAGTITLRSIAPGSGATLTVGDCPNSVIDRFKERCSDPTHITVDVEFAQALSNAVVTASFYSGTKRCGIAYSDSSSVTAGNRRSFEVLGAIELSDEYIPLHCPPPAETTRMVIQLWDVGRPATPLLTQEFAHRYTFADP